MKKSLFLSCFLLMFLGMTSVHSEDAHVHGQAHMNVVLDDDAIEIVFTVPAESLVGFEHAPHTEAENESVTKALQSLADPNAFTFYERRGLLRKISPVLLAAEDVEAELELEDHAGDPHNHDAHGHTEFELSTRYVIPSGKKISILSTQLFDQFSHLHKIVLVVFSDETQTHYVLSPENSRVKL